MTDRQNDILNFCAPMLTPCRQLVGSDPAGVCWPTEATRLAAGLPVCRSQAIENQSINQTSTLFDLHSRGLWTEI